MFISPLLDFMLIIHNNPVKEVCHCSTGLLTSDMIFNNKQRGRALQFVGRYHLPVNSPLFRCKSHTHCPCGTIVKTQWPDNLIFKISHFSHMKCKHAFQKFYQFPAENGKYSLNLDPIYTQWPPILRSSHPKRSILDPTPIYLLFWSFFYKILHQMPTGFVLQ